MISLRPSRRRKRGVSRSSRTLEAGCGGREEASGALARRRRRPLGRPSRVVLSPRRWGQACETDVARRRWLTSPVHRSVHRGERGAAVNTIARGMPVVPAEPVVTAACFPSCRRAMGAASIRHSPRPLLFEGGVRCITRACRAAGTRRRGPFLRSSSRRGFRTARSTAAATAHRG
jgi:hypothetical protein